MKKREPIVGYCYLVADLFHLGHLKHLQRCKKHCDVLYAGILTDAATMEKKPAPIISFEERLEIVDSIKYVDKAVEQKTYSPLENAVALGVDVLFESVSHTPEAIKEAKETMAKIGAHVLLMPYYDGQSSTAIKEKILKEWIKPEQLKQVHVKEFNDESRKT